MLRFQESIIKPKGPTLGMSGLVVLLLNYGAEQDLFWQFFVVVDQDFHVDASDLRVNKQDV